MSELFPNAYGIKLWAVIIGCIIMAACAGAFLHSLYELWMSDRPKKTVYELDEFEDRDDPFAIAIPSYCPRLLIKEFDSAVEVAAWITGNLFDPVRQEQVMSQALMLKRLSGKYMISILPTREESAWMS